MLKLIDRFLRSGDGFSVPSERRMAAARASGERKLFSQIEAQVLAAQPLDPREYIELNRSNAYVYLPQIELHSFEWFFEFSDIGI